MKLNNRFSLYEVEFLSASPDELLLNAVNFSEYAEVDFFDRKNGVMRIGFVSPLSEAEVLSLCDDYKKQVESTGSDRLTYKVKVTSL